MTSQDLFLAYETQRQAIEKAYVDTEMTEKEKARMIALSELAYRKAQMQAGYLDAQFEVRTIDEAAKSAAIADCASQIAAIPDPDWEAYGLADVATMLDSD
jgi:hypothetical protein